MSRRIYTAILVTVSLLVMLYPGMGRAAELDVVIDEVIESMDFGMLSDVASEIEGADSIDIRELIRGITKGDYTMDAQEILGSIEPLFLKGIRSCAALAVQIALPALLCALLSQLGQAFSPQETSRVAQYTCFLLLLVPLVACMLKQTNMVKQTVEKMATSMQVIFPMLLTLLAAVGGSASSAFLQPAILAASGVVTQTVQGVTLRLAVCCGAVTAVNHLAERVHLTRLAKLIRTAANWTLGVCFTVFIGVMTVQGVGSAAVDGVSLRTAKYAIDNFVPVVGGMVADTMDMLVGCSLLVKNAIGIVSLMLLVLIVMAPLVELGAAMWVLKLCAAILEPVVDKNVTECIDDFSGVLSLLFITLLCVGVMFFLLVAQLLLVGNLTVMLR